MTPTEREMQEIIQRVLIDNVSMCMHERLLDKVESTYKVSERIASALIGAGYGPKESDLSWCVQTLQVFAGYDVYQKFKDGTLSKETQPREGIGS